MTYSLHADSRRHACDIMYSICTMLTINYMLSYDKSMVIYHSIIIMKYDMTLHLIAILMYQCLNDVTMIR